MKATNFLLIFLFSIITFGFAQNRYNNEFLVNTTTDFIQENPTIGVANDGSFIVIWESYNHPGTNNLWFSVVGQKYDKFGNPLGSEFIIDGNAGLKSQTEPEIAIDAQGRFYITWMGKSYDDTLSNDIYLKRYDANGDSLGPAIKVNTQDTLEQGYPDIATDSNGNLIVVWEGMESDSTYNIYAQLFDSLGNAIGGNFIVNTYQIGDQMQPSVDRDENGNFVVAWQSDNQDGDWWGIFAQRFDKNGNKIGSEFQVNEEIVTAQRDAHVSIGKQGQFIIAWQSSRGDGDDYGIFAKGYNADGTIKFGETQINTNYLLDQREPQVDIDSLGNFVVVWHSIHDSTGGKGWGIYARRMADSGIPLSDEFQVNTFDIGDQKRPAVGMEQKGDFTIVWDTEADPTSLQDVKAQMYKFPPVFSSLPQITLNEDEIHKKYKSYFYPYIEDKSDPDENLTFQFGNGTYITTQFLNDTLEIIPDPNWFGTDSFMVIVTDPTNLSDTTYQIIVINPVNDAPVVSDILDQTINEGENFATINLDDYVTDVDDPDS
ncbi:MAG: hypothetical protein ACTSQ8_20390, partial [Candidatus Helarchaeota archaeon]